MLKKSRRLSHLALKSFEGESRRLPIRRTGRAGDLIPLATAAALAARSPPVEPRVVPTRRYQFAYGVSVDRRGAASVLCYRRESYATAGMASASTFCLLLVVALADSGSSTRRTVSTGPTASRVSLRWKLRLIGRRATRRPVG